MGRLHRDALCPSHPWGRAAMESSMSPPAESRWSSGYFGSSTGFDISNPILLAYPTRNRRASRALTKAVARVSIYPTGNRPKKVSEAYLNCTERGSPRPPEVQCRRSRRSHVPSAPRRHVKRYSRRISPRLDRSKGPWSAIRGAGCPPRRSLSSCRCSPDLANAIARSSSCRSGLAR